MRNVSYLIFGHIGGFTTNFDVSSLDGTNGFAVNAEPLDGSFKSVAGIGDINGDGKDDIALGAPDSYFQTGVVYVIFGQSDFPAVFNLTTLNGASGFVINGLGMNDALGTKVTWLGDMNGDGYDDLAISEGLGDDRAYAIFGSNITFPNPFDLYNLNGNNGFVVLNTGAPVGIGDFNNDKLNDLALVYLGGRVSIVFGSAFTFENPLPLNSLNGTNGFVLYNAVCKF